MDREIKFEDLPEKMQNDWCKYLKEWENQEIKILKIITRYSEGSHTNDYKIYYEFGNVVGVCTKWISDNGYEFDTTFEFLTVGDLMKMYNLSSLIQILKK